MEDTIQVIKASDKYSFYVSNSPDTPAKTLHLFFDSGFDGRKEAFIKNAFFQKLFFENLPLSTAKDKTQEYAKVDKFVERYLDTMYNSINKFHLPEKHIISDLENDPNIDDKIIKHVTDSPQDNTVMSFLNNNGKTDVLSKTGYLSHPYLEIHSIQKWFDKKINFLKENGRISESINPSEKEIFQTLLDKAAYLTDDKKQIVYYPDHDPGINENFNSIAEIIHQGLQEQYRTKQKGYLTDYVQDELNEDYSGIYLDDYLDNICTEALNPLKKKYPFMDEVSVTKKLFDLAQNNTVTDTLHDIRDLYIPITIVMKSEELNKDFSVKNMENIPERYRPDDYCAMYYLVKNQGYKDSDFQNLMNVEQNDNFLKSVRDELKNCSSDSNVLAFLVQMNLTDLQKTADSFIDKSLKYINLSKNTACGLYDPWNGGGSLMDINLNQNMSVSNKHIQTIAPDGFFGYSLESIYGKVFEYENAFPSETPVSVKKLEPQNKPLKNLELYFNQCNQLLSKSLFHEYSVLLDEREGVDYSIDNNTKKPFSGINQLVAQQIRKNENYENPNFSRYGKNIEFDKESDSSILSHAFSVYDPVKNETFEHFYFNHDQLSKHPPDYEPVKADGVSLPNIPCYQNNNIDILRHDVHNYFASLFSGEKYVPSAQTKKNAKELGEMLAYKVFSLSHFCNQAQNNINENIKSFKNNKNEKEEIVLKRGRK